MSEAKTMRVEDALIQMHAQMAATAFKDHVVTLRLDVGMFRSWRCQKPGTWAYGFDVTTTPGYLILTGDIGEMILRRCDDMIAWTRSSIRDAHYFAEKVPNSIQTKEWSFEKSLEWINETAAEDAHEAREQWDELRDELVSGGINGGMSEHEFCTALYESNLVDGCDWPNLEVFNSNFLWCREAVICLLRLIAE